MGFSLRNFVRGAVADVNPFDHGASQATVNRPAPASTAPPQQQQQRSFQPAPQQHQSLISRGFHDITHNPITNFVGRDIVQPVFHAPQAVDNFATHSAVGRGAQAVGLGALRSAVGTGQAVSGLADLLSPGTGTNRFSKSLNNIAKSTDQTAKAEHSNPLLYHGAQAATDALQFATGGGELKALGQAPKLANVADVASKITPVVDNAVAAKTAGLAEKGFAGRVAAKTIQNAAKPGYQAANAGFTALQVGKNASQGNKTTPLGVTTQLVAGGVGFPAAGALTHEALGPVANKAVGALRDAHLVAPSKLNTQEVANLAKFRSQAGTGALMDDQTYQAGVAAANKAGIDYRNPQAVDNLLGAHKTFSVRSQQRRDRFSPTPLNSMGGGAVENSPIRKALQNDAKAGTSPTTKLVQPAPNAAAPATAETAQPVVAKESSANSSIDPLAALKQEALKYKSADEFVNSFEKRYHQTSPEAAASIEKTGFRVDNRTSGANDILPVGVNTKAGTNDLGLGDADSQMQVHFTKDAKVPKFANRDALENYFYGHKDGEKFRQSVDASKQIDDKYQKSVDDVGKQIDARYKEIYAKGIKAKDDPQYQALHDKEASIIDEWDHKVNEQKQIAQAESTRIANQEGWDGVHMDKDVGSFGRTTDNTIILDPSKVKTKQQLTDLYNQAHTEAKIPVSETPLQKSERLHQAKLAKNNLTQNEYASLHQNVTDLEHAASQAQSATHQALDAAPRDAAGKLTPQGQAQVKKVLDTWTKAQNDHIVALNKVRVIDGEKPIVLDKPAKVEASPTKQTNAVPQTPKPPALTPPSPTVAQPPIVGTPLPKTKASSFANKTVQNSPNVTKLTKQLVKEGNVQYTPEQVANGQAAADKFAKGSLAKKTLAVKDTLNNSKLGAITRQDAFNAHAIVDRLQSTGTPANAQHAADILSKLSEHHTAAGQLNQAAAALSKRSPLGIVNGAQKLIENGGKGGKKQSITPAIATKLQVSLKELKATHAALNKAVSAHEAAIAASEKRAIKNGGKFTLGELDKTHNAVAQAEQAKLIAHEKLQQLVSDNIHHSAGSKLFALWRTGLLTGPKTATKIAVSHTGMGALEQIKQVPAVGLDKAISAGSILAGKGTRRSTALTARGGKEFVAGLKASGQLLKTGHDTPNTGGFEGTFAGSLTHNNVSFKGTKLDKLTHGVSGKVLNAYTTKVGQFHASVPKPFFTYAQANDLARQAIASGKNAGLKGEEMQAHIDHYIKSASDAAKTEAQRSGQFAAFQQESAVGKVGRGIQNLPGGKAIMPFARIASTILADAAHYSPVSVGIAGHDIIKSLKSGEGWSPTVQKHFVEELGRGITGTGIGVIGYELAKKGLITGGYPTNPTERKLWEVEGKTPNSILIGGKWRSTSTLEPAGTLLAGGQAAYEATQSNAKGKSQLAPALTGALQDVTSQSYLSGITGLSDAIAHPTQYGTKFLKQEAGSVVPVAVAQTATATDPLQRNTTGFTDSLKSKIPGLRETLTPKQGVFGNDLGRQPGPGLSGALQNLLDPSRPSTAVNSPLVSQLQNIYDKTGSAPLPTTVKSINAKDANGNKTTVPLNTQQQHDFATKTGPQIQQSFQNIINNPNFSKLTPANQAGALSGARNDVQMINKAATVKDTNSGKTVKLTQDQQSGNLKDYVQSSLNKQNGVTGSTAYYKSPDAEYKDLQAKFDNNVKNNGFASPAAKITAQTTLAKAKAGSTFDKSIRDAYGLSDSQLYNYVTNDPNGNDIAKQVIAYGDKLVSAGVETKNKFRNKKGAVTLGSSTVSKSSGGSRISSSGRSTTSSSKGISSFISSTKATNAANTKNQKALQNLLKGSQFKTAKTRSLNAPKVALKKQNILPTPGLSNIKRKARALA